MNIARNAHEVNFDCLVGPTHHFGGLSFGNLASLKNTARPASPKKAALQGLEKMRVLFQRGFIQGILPPHERPHIKSLRNLGFTGPDEVMTFQAFKKMPKIFSSLCSSSSMWAANAATISPSFDSLDNKTHISPANLVTMFHRSIEHEFAYRVFQLVFADANHFIIHPPLLPHDLLSDEGAANHNRLCPHHGDRGLQIFVYGKDKTLFSQRTSIFPARQSKLANDVLALRHRLHQDYFLNIEQNALAIDKGAFHNDVVAVANENVLLCHELAFSEHSNTIALIRESYQRLYHEAPLIFEVNNDDLSIEDAVSSYLFNSQLLTKPNGRMLLFAPTDTEANDRARNVVMKILADNNPIDEVSYFDVSESMANGGGPACLRLRVLLTTAELARVKPSVLFTDHLFDALANIIDEYYVDELLLEHFFDKNFLDGCKRALEKISSVLGLGSIYDFQR